MQPDEDPGEGRPRISIPPLILGGRGSGLLPTDAPRPAREAGVPAAVPRYAPPPARAEPAAPIAAPAPVPTPPATHGPDGLPLLVEPPAPTRVVADVDAEGYLGLPGEREVPPFRLLLPGGAEVAIDAPVLLGRQPRAPRIPSGVVPRLVALASPAQEISGTHLEVSVVGGALVATDLSTNGTLVAIPGAAPRRLIRGESAAVVPGTRIDLGDGALLVVLPPRAEAS